MSNLVLHHLHRKRRKTLRKEFDYAIYVAAIISPLALVPQVVQIFSTHSVAGLSLVTWIIFTAMNGVWLVYGLVHQQRPIIIANALSGILDFTVVIGILLFH